ncbi:lysosome-associated membrane glycoprotein 5 [Chelonus insularis]|uniref:lysosome-associated membrane glycoprotein 5 n=1 Tax=Chelonus insularis TaxID=460826 RepID=UPI00158BED0B|nr:lysosome-associated membrane glycoprotein 5 [Chelonus insularis]
MIHIILSKEFFLLWNILSTALCIPSTPGSPRQLLDHIYTTSRPIKTIVEFHTPKSLSLHISGNTVKPSIETSTSITSSIKTTTSSTPRIINAEQPLYRLNSINGQTCILLQVDALITVKFRTRLGEEQEANIYVPSDATVTGNCDTENFVTMSLKWKAFVLSWSFAKTPGGERWYVDKIELTYNSSDRHFEHIDQPNKTIRLSTGQKHSPTLFPTPVGKSYVCDEEVSVPLTDGKNNAVLLLRDMKLQPFKYKSNDFAAEFSCKSLSARAGRDETAPVAVGSTLAAAVLLTITGYAAWRYFKVKKVKYDTME